MRSGMAIIDTHKGPLLLAIIGNESQYGAIVAVLRTKKVEELSFDLY